MEYAAVEASPYIVSFYF